MNFQELVSKLNDKLPDIKVYLPKGADGETLREITSLVSDSRKTEPGAIFACVAGEHSDGHNFAAAAKEKGAVALLCERKLDVELPQIILSEVRRNMGTVAAALYGNPADSLLMIALTGTNGKTTSTFMIRSILRHAGIKTGLIGTVYCDDGESFDDAEHTTPEGSDLQQWLNRMAKNSCKACVMETSSHAIEQGRIEGVAFDRVGFTNLSVEHLDYHLTMEGYFQAKKLLFDNYMRGDWKASVNVDDEYGTRLFNEFRGRSVSYGIQNDTANFRARILGVSIDGMEVGVSSDDGKKISFTLPMLGSYNVSNALQAISIASTLGISLEDAAEGLKKMDQVPGRLERYMVKDSGSCVIDFAHSPDGLEKVLKALRPVCKGKLVVAFGAGGDRDRTKRPIMGRLAAKIADKVIITSDNPRSEDPNAIALEVEEGAKEFATEREVIVNRKEAIFRGLSEMKADDIFVIAGKGPERYQILKDETIPFLDRDVLFEWCSLNGKEVL